MGYQLCRLFERLSSLLLLLLLVQPSLAALMPPKFPVHRITGDSYRTDHSTAVPVHWVEVEWEEIDDAGNHSITLEPTANVCHLPLVKAYLAKPAVQKTTKRLRATAMKQHGKNVVDANRIASFVVLLSLSLSTSIHTLTEYTPPAYTHTLRHEYHSPPCTRNRPHNNFISSEPDHEGQTNDCETCGRYQTTASEERKSDI